MYKNINPDFTYKLGLAHEGLTPGYDYNSQPVDKKMDIHNNRFGREYYNDRKYKGLSNYDVSYHMYYQIKNNSKSLSSGITARRIRVHSSIKNSTVCNKTSQHKWYSGYCTKYVGWYMNSTGGGGKY